MDGAASDLRTGLPWQMVEIHEPVRILFVIETTPEKMLAVMGRNPAIGRLVRNGWVHLAVLDPDSPAIQVFRDGRVPRLPADRPTTCRGRRRRWTGTAAGGTTWSSPRSGARRLGPASGERHAPMPTSRRSWPSG